MADCLIELWPVGDDFRHQLLFNGLTFVLGVATKLDEPLGVLLDDSDRERMTSYFLCCNSHGAISEQTC